MHERRRGYDAERLVDAFPGMIEAEGALIDDHVPERLDKFHYDLVATTTFHADEAQVLAAGRLPVVAMLVGRATWSSSTRSPSCRRVRGWVWSAPTSAARRTSSKRSRSRCLGVEIVPALIGETEQLAVVDDTADLILMSREALAAGLDQQMHHEERIRQWSYEFDPAGLELLRRAIEHVAAERPVEASAV